MIKLLTGRIGVKVAVVVNIFIVIVMTIGTYFLISRQSRSLEAELLKRGTNLSIIGARMTGVIIEEAVDNGSFTVEDVFDTDYVPIGNFDPPKYHTRYDAYLDKAILGLQDEFLIEESMVYAVASDRNGYVPTHNTRYQKPITGDPAKDRLGNRTKAVFNDPVGLAAARTVEKGLSQFYQRDSGEKIWDVSSPIYVKGKHWGGFRVGLSLGTIEAAKTKLSLTLFAIMTVILFSSLGLTFLVVNHSLAPLKALSGVASDLADGKRLHDEIRVTNHDEVGALQQALERLRMSMLIALKRR